jgi:hypothetical protein
MVEKPDSHIDKFVGNDAVGWLAETYTQKRGHPANLLHALIFSDCFEGNYPKNFITDN